MPPKPQQPARANFARQNRQQLAEQQALNRERVKQDEYEEQRKAQLIARQKAQYESGPRVDMSGRPVPSHQQQHASQPQHQAGAGGAARNDDVRIDVFVRECDADGMAFGDLESALINAAQARQQRLGPNHQQHMEIDSPPKRAAPAAAARGRGAQQQVGSYSTGRGAGSQPSSGRAPPAAGSAALGLRQQQHTNAQRPGSNASGAARGQVPDYLKQRKAELQAEKDEARRIADLRAEQSKYPPGHRPVSEEERHEILEKLANRKKELEADIGRLPMRFDTQAIRQRRQQIEAELLEVEAAERKFSVKKQLYVPI